MTDNVLPIAIEAQSNNAVALKVLVQSIKDCGDIHSKIYIFSNSLSEDDRKAIAAMADAETEIDVIPEQKIFRYFSREERVLVLNPETQVLGSLKPLAELDMGDAVLAAVPEYDPSKDQKRYSRKVYLCNVRRMHRKMIPEKLLWKTKIRTLPVRWAYMPSVFHLNRRGRWKIEKINELYATRYVSPKEMYQDAAIAVFDDACRPWENPDTPMGPQWKHELLKIMGQQVEPHPETCSVSVIIPCWNTEKWIGDALNSILEQQLPGMEILCMDDGSADNTLNILKEYQSEHPQIRICSNENHGQGWERNQAIRLARGKYIYFMDSDDCLEPGTLKYLYQCAEENQLDTVFFEGSTFYDSEGLKEKYADFKNRYSRKYAWPAVYTGRELYTKWYGTNIMENHFVACVMMMNRRSFLLEKKIEFADTTMYEDQVFYYQICNATKRAMCLPNAFYRRRVRESSTMTGKKPPKEKADAFARVAQELEKELSCEDESFREATLNRFGRLMDMKALQEFCETNEDEVRQSFAEQVASYPLARVLAERQRTILKLKNENSKLKKEIQEIKKNMARH